MGRFGLSAIGLRHPANGGANLYREGFAKAIGQSIWWGVEEHRHWQTVGIYYEDIAYEQRFHYSNSRCIAGECILKDFIKVCQMINNEMLWDGSVWAALLSSSKILCYFWWIKRRTLLFMLFLCYNEHNVWKWGFHQNRSDYIALRIGLR